MKPKWPRLAAWLLVAALSLIVACQPAAPGDSTKATPKSYASSLALFIEPQDGYTPIVDAIDNARRSIRVKAYLLTSSDIIDALQAAARRGVSVRLLLEHHPHGGSVDLDLIAALQRQGVIVKEDSQAFTHMHEKTLVIDDETAIIMTGNLTASAFRSNREYGVIVWQPQDVSELIAVFEADWARQEVDLSDSRLIWSPDNARERILALIDQSTVSLDIEHQNMQDVEIVRRLEDALARGVRLRLICTPGDPIERDPDEPGRQALRRAGAQIRYLYEPYVHAKVLVVDGRLAMVGSQNLTSVSLDFNREAAIVFEQASAVDQLLAQFRADWALADEVTASQRIIAHENAADHFGETLTVELEVTHVYNSGRVIWLMPDKRQDENFKVVIFPSHWSRFAQRPDLLYTAKTIRVRGLIEEYRGWPEIIISDPEQIEIVAPT